MAVKVFEHKYDPVEDIFDKKVVNILHYFAVSYSMADDTQKDAMLQVINDAEKALYQIDQEII